MSEIHENSPLPSALIEAMRDPRCYPHPVAHVEVVETHISWVLLTGEFAYKVKKPLALDFLDFSTVGKREHSCREELRLNRRLAPELYLDVVPITGAPAAPCVEGHGPAIEYAVKMRQFESGTELSCLIAAGNLTAERIDELADALARFHAACAEDRRPDGYGKPVAVHAKVQENFAPLLSGAPGIEHRKQLSRLQDWTQAEYERLLPLLDTRRAEGFVRECHGDLHLGNIALFEGRILIFDCIEFDPGLRWIDVMSEVAFLVMDLHARGRGDYARRLLNRYLERSGDYAGVAVLRYYLVYRALVRAKICAIRASQAGPHKEQALREGRGYCAFAERCTRPPAPLLLITHGMSGSGKTTVTSALLEVYDLIRVRSDVERKRLEGLAAEARSGSEVGGGLYTAETDRRTYHRLLDVARQVIEAGWSAVVDATFIDRAQRDLARAVASDCRVPFRIIACRAAPAVLRQRVESRERLGSDASEATLVVLDRQLKRGEALDPDEQAIAVQVDTTRSLDARALGEKLGLA